MPDPRPIGVFDSGVGGLTVLREIIRRLPGESTLYLGDNGRAPYGVRSDDEVLAFSTESLDALVERDVKALVVACNTSTAVGLGAFRHRYDLPVLGVIRPGAAAAALATRNRRVGVIATPATIRSHAYLDAIKDENPTLEVFEHATPALVPMVEAGQLAGAVAESTVADALAPLIGERAAERRVDPAATGRRHDRYAAARVHPLPTDPPAHRRARRRDRGDRRFRHGHRVGAGRAAERQPSRGRGRRRRDPRPAHDRRSGTVRATWPAGCSGRSSCRSVRWS